MKTRIYLAGIPQVFTDETNWRKRITKLIEETMGSNCIVENVHYTDAIEFKEFAATKIRKSDVLIVDTNSVESDYYAIYDISIADEINRSGNKRIYIFGFGDEIDNVRIEDCIMARFESIGDIVDFMAENNIIF